MKNVLKKCVVGVALLIMVFSMNVFAYDTGNGIVWVSTGSSYVTAKTGIERSRNYSYAIIKASSVYPTEEGKTDNYTKCKTRLYYDSTAISNAVTLTEGQSTNVYIYEGHLAKSTFALRFAGNNPDLSAYIAYYYNGK